MRAYMSSRERVTAVLAGGIPDRVPMCDKFWQLTIDRWRAEGLPPGVSPGDFLGVNELLGIGGDFTMQFPERLVEDEGERRTYWDSEGALRRDYHTPHGWTSQWLDYTIKNRDDWLKHRDRLRYDPSRVSPTALATYRAGRNADRFICYQVHGCFHPTWMRVGMVQELMLLLDDPSWIHEMFSAQTQMLIDMFDAMWEMGMSFDGARISDDLGSVAGPLISPALYQELIQPYHKRLCDHFTDRGLTTILHSDGGVGPLIPHFLDAGFRALNPLEAKAGLDVRDLKPRFGDRLVLYGNIDARKLSGSREEIEEEIRVKVGAGKMGGGYIFHSDHSVPSDVSLDNYRFAVDMALKYGSYE